jgi:hypothetical protein
MGHMGLRGPSWFLNNYKAGCGGFVSSSSNYYRFSPALFYILRRDYSYMVRTESDTKFMTEPSRLPSCIYESNSMFTSLSLILLRPLSYLGFYNPSSYGLPISLLSSPWASYRTHLPNSRGKMPVVGGEKGRTAHVAIADASTTSECKKAQGQ